MMVAIWMSQRPKAIPPKAIVHFEDVTLMVDERMKWEKAADAG